jgi:transcriptional regulator with PAS, ATPase and Fis domain
MLVDGGVRVRDAGSTNGVLVGNCRVHDAVFSSSVTLQLGRTIVNIWLGGSDDPEPVAACRFGGLLGSCPRMRELFADLARIAKTDLSVLIEGETGTGKDLVASSLHDEGPRAAGPFVVFDCAAVAPTLAESELFGHERGAFTGAVGAHAGVFEQANGGTIFLDEIGELPRELQPKLLRVLEKRQVRRLGDSKTIPVDVRVVAATNRNLRSEVKLGQFREDLYYRLAGAHVSVPPLRERPGDVKLLAAAFLAARRPPRRLRDIPPYAWDTFNSHGWPGNVRELKHALERVLVTPEQPLDTEAVAEPSGPSASVFPILDNSGVPVPLQVARANTVRAFEKLYLLHLLESTEGNVTRAASLAHVSRQMIHRLMLKHRA